jgi:penicillin-binding protein-related factor A (putative recombinase)
MALESSITKRILGYLNRIEGCIAEKIHGNAFTKSGTADINACYKGKCIKIEVKTSDHGNKTSKLQERYLRNWAKAGAICVVAYSLREVEDAIYLIDTEESNELYEKH